MLDQVKIVSKWLIEKNEYFFTIEYYSKRFKKLKREVRQGRIKKDGTVTINLFGDKYNLEVGV